MTYDEYVANRYWLTCLIRLLNKHERTEALKHPERTVVYVRDSNEGLAEKLTNRLQRILDADSHGLPLVLSRFVNAAGLTKDRSHLVRPLYEMTDIIEATRKEFACR